MKKRLGFVSNSSSTAFTIWNTTSEPKTLVDFVIENANLLDRFKKTYDWHKDDPRFTQDQMMADARELNETFKPKGFKILVFGDEQGTTIGNVYDYILRDGGSSKSFEWEFKEFFR